MTMRPILGAIGALLAIVWLGVWVTVRMPLLGEVGEEQATSAIRAARESLQSGTDADVLAQLTAPQRDLPVILTLYDAGQPVARGVGRGDSFGSAVRDAVHQLRGAALDPSVLERGRIKLDRVVGQGFLSSSVLPLFALGAVPGRDGLSTRSGNHELFLTNDDLTRARLWSGYQPLPFMEFQLGINVNKTIGVIARELGEGPRWIPRAMTRFRAEEYIERGAAARAAPAQPVIAGHTPGLPVTKQNLMDGARAGGAFLLEHLNALGRFDYEYYTIEDSRVNAGYSIPRHAGATSFLSQLYALDHDETVRAGAERALKTLEDLRPTGCGGRIWPKLCVGEASDRIVDLGSSALALVAALEYERTTGDRRFARFARGLTEFVLWMQKPDGDYCHLFDVDSGQRDEKTQLLYYSGEAAYGLGKLLLLVDQRKPEAAKASDKLLDDPQLVERASAALDRSLAYLTDGAYASFTSKFYIGEDHWTCMALDAGWDHLAVDHRDKYARFCDEFSRFLRRSQMRPGESLVEAQPQLAGAYGITSMLAPHTTPVGSRSETTISMWRIAKKRGLPDDDRRVREPREQVLDGMAFLLARQFRPELEVGGDYLLRNSQASRGGIPMSDVERHVRIDFIQHSCSAMLRALEML